MWRAQVATLVVVLLLAASASAQFFNFFQQGQGQSREQEAPPSGDSSWFQARVDAATCSNYLCPRTLACVTEPSRCPCPFQQQKRCSYPDGLSGKIEDGGFFCVSEEEGCEKVLLARGMWWNGKKLDKSHVLSAFS
ncbi:unnamed protein product [Parajaminaea phylloscopi]